MRAPTPHGPRDRTTIRRALIAGAVVWALVGGGLAALALADGLGARAAVANVVLGLPFGGVLATFWLWLANLLDVVAGEPPSRRRWLWALASTLGLAFVVPLLLAASVGLVD